MSGSSAPTTSAGIDVEVGGAELLDLLEPLWLALFDHHAATGAAGLPTIPREQSWPRRRALYEGLLAGRDAFVVLARRGNTPVGYALAHVHEGADDTWPTADRIGEVESLAVVASERGHGLGTLLLDTAEARLAEVGARDVLIGVLVGNDRALDFYRDRGMTPVVTKMLRLGPRPH